MNKKLNRRTFRLKNGNLEKSGRSFLSTVRETSHGLDDILMCRREDHCVSTQLQTTQQAYDGCSARTWLVHNEHEGAGRGV